MGEEAPLRPGSVYNATRGAGDLLVMASRADPRPLPIYNVTNPDLVSNPRIAEIESTFEPGGNVLVYERTSFDVSAVERDPGFVLSVSIEDGISRYVDWKRLRALDARPH